MLLLSNSSILHYACAAMRDMRNSEQVSSATILGMCGLECSSYVVLNNLGRPGEEFLNSIKLHKIHQSKTIDRHPMFDYSLQS